MLAAALAAAPEAWTQCSMCRTGAEAAGDGGAALNLAILVLLVPTLTFFVGILVISHRRADEDPAPKPRPRTQFRRRIG
jgi:hypothetical protein